MIPFRDRLRATMDEHSMTAAEVSRRGKIDGSLVSRVLSGDREPRFEHILAFSRAFGIEPSELTIGTDAEGLTSRIATAVEREVSTRLEAMAEAEKARADLAVVEAVNEVLRAQVASMEIESSEAKARARSAERRAAAAEARVRALEEEMKRLRERLR